MKNNQQNKLPTILISDDDLSIRKVLDKALSFKGYRVKTTSCGKTLLKWIKQGAGDLVITDVLMPDINGMDLVPLIQKERPDLKIFIMSAQNTILTALEASQVGAFEYFAKPFNMEDLFQAIEKACVLKTHLKHNSGMDFQFSDAENRLPIIGRSNVMQNIYRTLAQLIKTDLSVLITGDSGTGKELIARVLHDYGKRCDQLFIPINMASIPKELIESELFGHQKGSFTGATHDKIGYFQKAHMGTLFLDEIGDMPLDSQTRLLRVIQEGVFTPIGARDPIETNVRIIAATHRDLTQMIEEKTFRQDLYYRLNVVPIKVPALCERTEDIPELLEYFSQLIQREGMSYKTFTSKAIDALKNHSWPGNVRELENMVRRLSVLYKEDCLDENVIINELNQEKINSHQSSELENKESFSQCIERHIQDFFNKHDHNMPSSGLYHRILKEIEIPLIKVTLKSTNGNQIQAANILGINRNTLRKKIKDLNLKTY